MRRLEITRGYLLALSKQSTIFARQTPARGGSGRRSFLTALRPLFGAKTEGCRPDGGARLSSLSGPHLSATNAAPPILYRSDADAVKKCVGVAAGEEREAPSLRTPLHSDASPFGAELASGVDTVFRLPFRFDTGLALFAKRTTRPFPPPFLSPPSGSFSDPLSTHHKSRNRSAAAQNASGTSVQVSGGKTAFVDGEIIQGTTNGDDAVYASDYFICANDGVGAWSARPKGHAGLWARLILHFWAKAIFEDAASQGTAYTPDPVTNLQRAYEQTIKATSAPNEWQGTTTVAGAQLHFHKANKADELRTHDMHGSPVSPLLYVTNVGDSQVMVIRPSDRSLVYKSEEQWHWFDCPRQLGTNSPDTPRLDAVVDVVEIREGDVVLAMSDGVTDNLWAHEILDVVCDAAARWGEGDVSEGRKRDGDARMAYVAEKLKEAAKNIAQDPHAESPFMEHAIEEGLSSEGGKLDDISVVAAHCRRRDF